VFGWLGREGEGYLNNSNKCRPKAGHFLGIHSCCLDQSSNDPAELEEVTWAKTVRETLHGPNEYPKQLTMVK